MSHGVRVRETVEEDRDELFAISSRIWEGEDYIPALWDKWLEDGGFYTILHEDTIVGCLKTTWHGDREVIFEGLRIDPAFQGSGFASAAVDKVFKIVLDKRPRVMRFATGDENVESHHLGRKKGFVHVTSFYHRFLRFDDEDVQEVEHRDGSSTPGVLSGAGERVVVRNVDVAEAAMIERFMKGSPDWPKTRDFFSRGWVFYPLTSELLERELGEGLSFVALEKGKMTGVLLAHRSEQYPQDLDISWLSGSEDAMAVLLATIKERARELEFREIGAKSPSPGMASFMERHGFHRHEHVDQVLVFEKVLEQ